MKRAIVAGASGLIGSKLVQLLLKSSGIEEVVALVRSPLNYSHIKLKQKVVDFNRLEDYRELIKGYAVYCCLGTTKSKTPDLTDYRRIDHDYPVKLAELASRNGVRQYHLISALGADKNSSIFYNRFKGETEEDIKKYRFESLHIYQPSLLTGERSERRILEKLSITLMKVINPILIGSLKKYQSIKAETVAQAMLNQTLKETKGINTYPSDIIKLLA